MAFFDSRQALPNAQENTGDQCFIHLACRMRTYKDKSIFREFEIRILKYTNFKSSFTANNYFKKIEKKRKSKLVPDISLSTYLFL